jgi:lipid-A-disaccharide synthase
MSRHDARPATIMLVAGEASGDLHGGALCRALVSAAPGLRLVGLGGASMAAAGLVPLGDIGPTAVVGVTEVVRRLPALQGLYRRLAAAVTGERPAALVLIDFPGFNLRLARIARRAGVPVVYFIPPQVWAWGRGRLQAIRDSITLVLAIFPFEAAVYRDAGVPVEFVGHPVLDAVRDAPSTAQARRILGLAADDLVIGLLPGSRAQEIARMTPLLRDAALRIRERRPAARFLLALAPGVDPRSVAAHLAGGPPVEVVHGQTPAVMRAANLLLVTSGTATLEAALLGAPMVVCYRLSWVTERVARWALRVPWASLVNLVLGRPAVPELCLRHLANPERLAAEALAVLDTPGAIQAQRAAFAELAGAIGEPGVAARAARHVLDAAGLPSLTEAAAGPATAGKR